MHIVISGGSGFVGTALTAACLARGYKVTIIDQKAPIVTDDNLKFLKVNLLDEQVELSPMEADAVVQLSGANVGGKWTADYKKLIFDSRVKTTARLATMIKSGALKTKVFVTASANGYYGDTKNEIMSESNVAGNDFLGTLAANWEAVAREVDTVGVRHVAVRTGVVIGAGGYLTTFKKMAKYKILLAMGKSEAWFSWIHIDDLVNIYLFAITNDSLSGPINAVTPQPINNRELWQALKKYFGLYFIVRVPPSIVKLILGERSMLLLNNTRVVPAKLLANNFAWHYLELNTALKSLHV